MQVKCYGGCLHGKIVHHDTISGRICARDYRKVILDRHWLMSKNDPFIPEPNFHEVSYEVDWWHEQIGNACRRMQVAVLEGTKLFDYEEYEIRRDLSKIPWEPMKQFSFLKDFEQWWAWKIYYHTGNEYQLLSEMRHAH